MNAQGTWTPDLLHLDVMLLMNWSNFWHVNWCKNKHFMPLLQETKQSVHAHRCLQVWRVMLMTGERPFQSHEKDSSSLSTSALAPPWKNWPVKCLFLMQTWTKNGQKLIPFTCSFAHPLIHLFSHSFVHSLIWLFIHLIVCSFIHLFICLFVCALIHLHICSFAHSIIHSFAHLLIHLFTHLLIHLMNGEMDESSIEQTKEWTKQWTNEWMKEWMSWRMNEWVNEWNKWTNDEWAHEWVHEWQTMRWFTFLCLMTKWCFETNAFIHSFTH